MKVLVYAHRLELGGTQVNAIELTSALATQCGHDVVLLAEPGPAGRMAVERGLRVVDAPPARVHPSPSRMVALRALIREEQPAVVHAWDWPQGLDAFGVVGVVGRVPLVCTVMSMTVPRMLPRTVPLTFGTPATVEAARRIGFRHVSLLEPPVDLTANDADAVRAAGARFATLWGLEPARLQLVIVSRLVSWMKLDGIRRALAAAAALHDDLGLQLTIVGEGPARAEVARRAEEVNSAAGREVVVVPGGMIDPRPAYAVSDVVLGMGGSALRALAFGKPLVVLGEDGFSQVFDPATRDRFVTHGFFGRGGRAAPDPLVEQIRRLGVDGARRERLGAFGREVARQRYGLDVAARRLDAVLCRSARLDVSTTARCSDAARVIGTRVAGRVVPERAKVWRRPEVVTQRW